MTVKELIEQLQKLPQDSTVIRIDRCWDEHIPLSFNYILGKYDREKREFISLEYLEEDEIPFPEDAVVIWS